MDILKTVWEMETLMAESEVLGAQTARCKALREKLEDETITVSVIGQFKRGKSTLINGFLGEKLLPTGIVPITSAVTEIRSGAKSAAVVFTNGLVKDVAFEDLGQYVNEQTNAGNKLGVSMVRLTFPSEFLSDGVVLVDTPGVGSVHKNNTEAAYDFVKESDAVVFLLSVDSPINEIEIDFLRNTREYAGKFFFAVNKIDTIGENDLSSYLAYCRMLLKAMMETDEITLWPISGKTGQGIEALKQALQKDLKARSREILEESSRLKLMDCIGSALSQIELYWKVLLMPPVVLKGTLSTMDARLTELKQGAAQLVHDLEADRDIIIPGLDKTMKARLNEFKQTLSRTVTETFGMDYHYEISELSDSDSKSSVNGAGKAADRMGLAPDRSYELASALGREYLDEVERLTSELMGTLEKVLLYRNSDTFEVVDRVYKLNTLTRTLKRTRRELESAEKQEDAEK